jgi:hypothetical protein
MAALFDAPIDKIASVTVRTGSGFPVNASDCVGCIFNVGDIIFNNAPGVNAPLGWVCIVASTSIGNPGTWAPLAGSNTNKAAGLSERMVAHATYNFAVDGGGAPGLITPAKNATIPINAIITNVIINSTTAVLAAAGAATIAIGTSAGSSANSLLAATAKASFGSNAFLEGIPRPDDSTTWVKMTAAGQITLTSATNPLTAGVVEIYVEYIESSS